MRFFWQEAPRRERLVDDLNNASGGSFKAVYNGVHATKAINGKLDRNELLANVRLAAAAERKHLEFTNE